jgi:hypothetical protein
MEKYPVNDRETAEKLKARINTWQSYIGQPAGNPRNGEPPEESAKAVVFSPPDNGHGNGHAVLAVHANGTNGHAAPAHLETVVENALAQIADLQATVDHEREQTRRLAETLAREQAMKTMRSQPPIDIYPQPNETRPYRRAPRSSRTHVQAFDRERRVNVAIWMATILAIAGLGTLFALLSIR